MATSTSLSYDEYGTNIDDQQLEIFCIIWLDDNTQASDDRDTEQRLRSIINRLKRFKEIQQCEQYINERSPEDRLILIVSGRLGRELVPSIHASRKVISIYVYCMDETAHKEWSKNYVKIKAVVTELNILVARIEADHKIQKIIEQPFSINFFTAGKSTDDVNGKFVFSQVLIDCLLRLKPNEADKKELIELFEKAYEDNRFELSNIRDFRKNYLPENAIRWYTRDSFFYKTLNAVLRSENIHMIFLFRSYISDIQQQLKIHQAKEPLRVYRGQMISDEELKTLKNSCGKFISINSFFSTSIDKNQARSFLDRPDIVDKLEKVLFEIVANPNEATMKPFSDISSLSEFSGESEILFMIGSIFRLNSVGRSTDDQVWEIQMALCSENEHDIKDVLWYMQQQLGTGDTNLHVLGKLLWNMGQLDLAEKYFIRLLEQLSPDDRFRGNLYEDLANLAAQTKDYNKSVRWRKKALKFKEEHPSESSISTSKFIESSHS
ncbi:unnamed protein product [Rotaria sp. Silwood1]|nr:unnamed protein product [Rotaria sp. Silwood1]